MEDCIKHCPVCYDTSIISIIKKKHIQYKFTDYKQIETPLSYPLNLLMCNNCTHLFLEKNIINTEKNLTNSLYKHGKTVLTEKDSKQNILIVDTLKSIIQTGKVLEIGSGYGCLLYLLYKNGFDAEGVEPGNAYFSSIERYPVIKVSHKLFNVKDYPCNSFDIVIVQNTLAFMPNIQEALKNIWDLLKTSGILLIYDINIEYTLDNGLYQNICLERLHYFNYQTLSILLKRNGFSLTSHKFVNEERNQLIVAYKDKDVIPKKIIMSVFNKFNNKKNMLLKCDLFAKKYKKYQQYIEKFINRVTMSDKKLAIYGAGKSLMDSFLLSDNGQLFLQRISYLIDGSKDKQGHYLPFVTSPIISLNEFIIKNYNYDNIVFVICAEQYYNEIVSLLVEKTKKNFEELTIFSLCNSTLDD